MEFIDFNPGLSLGKHPEWKLGDSSEVVSDTEQPARISALDTSRRTQTKTQTKTDTHKDRQNTHTYNAHRLKKIIHIDRQTKHTNTGSGSNPPISYRSEASPLPGFV